MPDGQNLVLLRNNHIKPPLIKSVTYTQDKNKTPVALITGKYFGKTTAANTVYFGAAKGTVTFVNDTSLLVNVPVGATYKPVTVLNTEMQLSGYYSMPFSKKYIANARIEGTDMPIKITAPTGTQPGAQAIADIDGDGKPDIIVANQGSGSISVFRNTYTGGTRTDLATGAKPVAVATGDLDNDGRTDIVVVNETDKTLSIFKNNAESGTIASSSFAAKVNLATGNKPSAVTIRDIDGNGKADILVTNKDDNTFSVYLNKGLANVITAASFQQRVSFGVGMKPTGIVATDFDNDGKADVVVANSEDSFMSLFQNLFEKDVIQASSFSPKIDLIGYHVRAITGGDFNADGSDDLVAITNYSVQPYYNNYPQASQFTAGMFYVPGSIATMPDVTSIDMSDFDGDGFPDLVVTGSDPDSIMVHRNGIARELYSVFEAGVKIAAGKNPAGVSTGDLTGDGKPDIAVTNASTKTISILVNSTLLSAPVITSFDPEKGPAGLPITIYGDHFDALPQNNIVYFGTAKAEILSASVKKLMARVPYGATYQPISVLNTDKRLIGFSKNSFAVTFESGTPAVDPRVNLTSGLKPRGVTIGDFNLDGKPDVAVANSGESSMSIFYNKVAEPGKMSVSSFTSGIKYATGTNPAAVISADIDIDGYLDIVTANYGSNSISFFASSPGTEKLFSDQYQLTTGLKPVALAISDLNGDGIPEIIVANSGSNTVSVFPGIKTGGWYDIGARVDFTAGSSPSGVCAADINGDGKPEIIVSNYAGNSVSILQNTTATRAANITFAAKKDISLEGGPQQVSAVDINKDGKTDIVVVNKLTNKTSVIMNIYSEGAMSASSFSVKTFTTGTEPAYAAIGDVSGEGHADIVVTNNTGNSISVLPNLSSGANIAFATKRDLPSGTAPQGVAIADFDGDGKPDIALAGSSANVLSIIRNASGTPSPLENNKLAAEATSASTVKFAIYPNPATTTANIRYQLPKQSDVEIGIFNMKGKQVASHRVANAAAGSNQIQVDVSALPADIYFINIQASGFNEMGKLLKN